MNLNAGCGTHYASGWVNTDVIRNDNTRPDVICRLPFPFPDGTFDRVFLGHVLEHVPWPSVPQFMQEVRRVAKRGGEVLAAGPDVYRTLEQWQNGAASWFLVQSVMEHQDQSHPHWPEAVHSWNCHQTRLEGVLTAAGFEEVSEVGEMGDWPAVGWDASWQCAALGLA